MAFQFEGNVMATSFFSFVVVAFWLAAAVFASAQDYPTKPVTLIVPYPAGGTMDVLARLLAEQLSSPSYSRKIA